MENCKPGITRQEVITRFGKPLRQTFFYNSDSTLTEVLYYKESVYAQRWHEINTILEFRNERLISMEQEEQPGYYVDSAMVRPHRSVHSH